MVKRTQKRPWPEANQACLVAEFARLRNLLDPKADATRLPEAEKIRGAMDAPPAIDQLTQLFGLVIALPLSTAAAYAAWKDVFGIRDAPAA